MYSVRRASSGKEPSRCTIPHADACVWHDFPADEAAILEIKQWLESLPEAVRAEAAGQIISLRKLASTGELREYDKAARTGEVRHVASADTMWELRWDIDGTLLRQYHGEPRHLSDHLISTHFHVKMIMGTQEETDRLQQVEIDKARNRYSAGSPVNWGCTCHYEVC